jgi:hypothetical protein
VGGGSSLLSCAVFLPPPLLQAFLLLITWRCCCSCQPPCLFTVHVGNGSSLLSCGVFLPLSLSQAFQFLVAGCTPLLLPEPLRPTQLVYLQFREGFPSPNLWHSVPPTLFLSCLYCSYCLLVSFSFFPGWRSVCPGGCAALAQACLWEYRGTAKLTWSASSQAVWVQATGGPGALLVSPFNVSYFSCIYLLMDIWSALLLAVMSNVMNMGRQIIYLRFCFEFFCIYPLKWYSWIIH